MINHYPNDALSAYHFVTGHAVACYKMIENSERILYHCKSWYESSYFNHFATGYVVACCKMTHYSPRKFLLNSWNRWEDSITCLGILKWGLVCKLWTFKIII